MDKLSYSKCPLKKRPIHIISEKIEEERDDQLEDEEPIDLSIQKHPKRIYQVLCSASSSSSMATIKNYSCKLDRIEEEHYNEVNSSVIRYNEKVKSIDNNNKFQLKSEPTVNLTDLIYKKHGSFSLINQSECRTINNNNFIKTEQYDDSSIDSPIRFNVSPPLSIQQSFSDKHIVDAAEDLTVKFKPFQEIINENSSYNNNAVTKLESLPRYRKEFQDRTNNDLYYQCNICNKCYSTYAGLLKHQQIHQQVRNTVLVEQQSAKRSATVTTTTAADSCNEDFNLENHRGIQIQRYQCKDCGKSYSTYSGLTKHQQFHCPNAAGNQVKKLFSCKNCDKVYVSLGALKMHIRTHTLPCKCPLCGKAFSRPWLLQGHIRTHTGEKPFSCQHCNRAFADRSNLRAHLQTHSDVKKYSCQSCTKTFSRMSLLGKHLQGGCPGGGSQTTQNQQNNFQQHHYDDISMYNNNDTGAQNSDNLYNNYNYSNNFVNDNVDFNSRTSSSDVNAY